MHRLRTRARKSSQHSWASIDSMVAVPQSPKSTMSLRGRDTGFPDSFCGHRNTCLPHPDANLSSDACLTEDDITVARAIARHRMSFQASRDRARALADTSPILTSHDDHYSDIYCASPIVMDSSHDDSSSSTRSRPPNVSTIGRLALTSLRGAELTRNLGGDPHKDADSLHSGGSSDQNSPTHPPARRDEVPQQEKRRRSFLRRLTHR